MYQRMQPIHYLEDPQKKTDQRKRHRKNGMRKLDQAQIILNCTHNYFFTRVRTSSHKTIPAAIEIFNECFIPHCGISTLPSHKASASSPTPDTSFPKTTANRPECLIPNSGKGILPSVCSIAKTAYPSSFKSRTASAVVAKYCHSTVS